ncbi:MAG: PDDEXK nuclease domain-containing protein [Gammaproteobacteria bacterium]|nr:PDDEXK nuclease domain-containing protein [Gammaproteobacteria bacterium]
MSKLTPHPDFSGFAELINARRTRAFRLVNYELIDLYWEIGSRISKSIQNDGWGRGTVNQLAEYLAVRVPGVRGFSVSNLWRMRQFYETWRNTSEELATLLRELAWSSHVDLLGRCKTTTEREFYLQHAIRENYSVRELRRAIDSATFERVALANAKLATVSRVLPPKAKHAFKDSYIVEFLELPPDHSEDELRRGLARRLRYFLSELGRDFTFIGEQYPIQVGTRDGFVDLLFFHRGLSSLVAIELKITAFEPEHIGQLNFYLEALDRDVRKAHENPSIGILLCKTKDDEVVEYAMSRSISPALVAEYQLQLPDKKLLQAKLHEFFELETDA